MTKAAFDSLRELAYTGVSASYAAIGSATTVLPRAVCITNGTNGDLIVSTDNTNASGNLILLARSYKTYDIQANMNPNKDDAFVLPKQLTMYAKQVTAPTSGSIYIEYLYDTSNN